MYCGRPCSTSLLLYCCSPLCLLVSVRVLTHTHTHTHTHTATQVCTEACKDLLHTCTKQADAAQLPDPAAACATGTPPYGTPHLPPPSPHPGPGGARAAGPSRTALKQWANLVALGGMCGGAAITAVEQAAAAVAMRARQQQPGLGIPGSGSKSRPAVNPRQVRALRGAVARFEGWRAQLLVLLPGQGWEEEGACAPPTHPACSSAAGGRTSSLLADVQLQMSSAAAMVRAVALPDTDGLGGGGGDSCYAQQGAAAMTQRGHKGGRANGVCRGGGAAMWCWAEQTVLGGGKSASV